MRVVRVTRFGGPEVLTAGRAPDPVPGPGEVVIQVVAADVLSVDAMIFQGWGEGFFPHRPPYVPGNGVVGTVTAVGPGADPGQTGLTVAAHTGGPGGWGGYAEQALVPAGDLIPVPAQVTPTAAAALLHDGATALGLLKRITITQGDQVLVTAAAGGLGALLVQCALAAGGRVIGAARSDAKLRLIRSLGADAVDYGDPGWAGRVRDLTGGRGADVVFDGAGGALGDTAFGVTAPGGTFSAHGMSAGRFAGIDPAQAEARRVTVHPVPQTAPDDLKQLAAEAFAAAAAGRVRPVIGQTFPLAQATDAHEAIRSRTAIGKTLLLPGREPA
jgi:NADPH:quinone reductase